MDSIVPSYEAKRMLDEEFMALRARTQNSLARLQARRNAIAPVSRLPNEILVDIFLIFQNWWKTSIKCWHHVTHICRHWRHVAIEAPILWTDIHVRSHEYALLMLERSQNAPLDVQFGDRRVPRPNSTTATMTAILTEIERIRTLSFTQMPINSLETAQTFLRRQGRQALILESLNVECSEPGPVWFNFSLDLFHPTASLRQLSVMSVQIDWNMLPIINLTHMNFIGVHTSVEVTGAQLVSAIRQMENLEELSIAFDDIRLCRYSPNFQPIPLSCLKSLSIYSDSDLQDQIQFFLSHIEHPQLDHLLVHCLIELPESPVVNSSSMISSVAASMKKGDFGTPWGLSIGQSNFGVYPEDDGLVSDKPNVQVYIPITADERSAETDFAVITDILTCIASLNPNNLIPLRRICLAKELAIPSEELIHLFGYLPHLEDVDVGGGMGLILLEALVISACSEDNFLPTDAALAFPVLQSVTWRDINEYVSEKLLLPDVLEYLCSSLSMRVECGGPVSRLVLMNSDGLASPQFERLRDVVDHVDVITNC